MSAAPIADTGASRLQRAHSTSARNAPQPSSSSRAHAYPNEPQNNLANVARRDFEQSNLAQNQNVPPPQARSASRERSSSTTHQHPHRSSSRSGPNSHAHSQSRSERRYDSIDTTQQRPTNGAAADQPRPSGQQPAGRRRTYIDCSTGMWALGKTIGAGSMGKVKLARNQATGEQVAVKIVPRQSTDEHRTPAERERADHSKEIRTAREAAIVSLVNHPYICGMRDVYKTHYHWYMLFEYVNGGQMLDYIISHGRLKEKGARKFARQIASALDYCHRNSIVHRDLKIENILISKTGDIKIIDFGLSNLFSPRAHLKTFCGSLYFAAPELLQAREYTGPEVDIWSFGVVLYVLVCGKVPFDDQSMPQLHAKIKKGYAEYPPWLTAECKHLISRMLVTDPRQRATLTEIMNHPWMTKGFNSPPENFLPHREALQLPLDTAVIQQMTGFDFGPPDYITTQLTKTIESDEYQRAVRNAAKKQAQNPEQDRSRGVFGFYKRRNSATSRDTLTNPSNEAVPLGSDPVNAYSPLISIYYLVREKMERDRVAANPGATEIPTSPGEQPLKLPDLPPPPAAYTNSAAYEMKGEAPTGGRTRPRARTQGEDEVAPDAEKLAVPPENVTPTGPAAPEQVPIKKESTAGALLRRISTRRRREPAVETKPPPPALAITSPSETGSTHGFPPRKSFSVRRNRMDRDQPSSASLNVAGTPKEKPEMLSPPAGNESFPRRFMSLRRAASVDRRRLARRGASEGHGDPPPPPTSGSDGSTNVQKVNAEEPRPDRAAGVAQRTKSLGHARRESIQARRARREEVREPDVREETDAELTEPPVEQEQGEDSLKPVYLKGLFSVSTTSSKPLPVIKADIIRVLKQLGVQYEEIKGGFLCTHAPSIDLKGKGDASSPISPNLQAPAPGSHRRKVSFSTFKQSSDRDDVRDAALRSPNTPKTPRPLQGKAQDGSPAISDTESEGNAPRASMSAAPTSAARDAGATSTRVRDEVPQTMALVFEIFIVKVPLFSFHGIQFKKVDGNIMHYKNMAQEILKALRL